MFKYSNECGKLYAVELFSDFLDSDYSEFKEEIIHLNENEFTKALKSKSFKEFLISRKNDYSYVGDTISDISYDYEDGLGNLLEIDPGKYEIICDKSLFNKTNPVILTKYNDPLFFTHDEEVHFGKIDFINLTSNKYSISRPIIRSNDILNINDFDTILYLIRPKFLTMLELLKYSYEKDKNIVTGLVSNVFDKNIEDKVDNIEELYNEINKKIPGYFELESEDVSGTVVRLIHSLK